MFSVTMSTNSGTTLTAGSSSQRAGAKRVVLLVSSLGANRFTRSRQHRAMTILDARGIDYEIVDGADPTQRARRDALFQISGITSYPQFFIAEKLGTTSFLGDSGLLGTSNFFSLLGCTNFSHISCFWCYPQGSDSICNDSVVALGGDDEDVKFLGDWDEVEQINDASAHPAHPSIKTWTTVLA